MERVTSVSTGMGEQSLTPGEQRILALLEQGQQRLEQRLQSLEEGQQRTGKRLQSLEDGQKRVDQRLTELKLELAQEAAASKMRDKELAADVQRLRDDGRERNLWLVGELKHTQKSTLEAMYQETNSLRTGLSERLDQHGTRLGVVERTLERHDEHLREHGQSLQGLRQEVRELTAAVERLAPAPLPPPRSPGP